MIEAQRSRAAGTVDLLTRSRSAVRPGAPFVLRTEERAPIAMPARRTKIWELSKHLHCSIIGTCLSTAELRHLLIKMNAARLGETDHDLHGQAVLLAGQHDVAGKLLQKALDKRHRLAISQFDKGKTAQELRALWQEAVKRGDIPGAYWAVLTHRAATETLVREVFGEVHMLSHLVGAANRADLRRLNELEAENGRLTDTLRRQESQLRDGFTARDARIREVSDLLARRIADRPAADNVDEPDSERATLARLVADLERRLAGESGRRLSLEKRLISLDEELRNERDRGQTTRRREETLREELAAVEASLASSLAAEGDIAAAPDLVGLTLLYVGGKPTQVRHLRAISAQRGATFLHHDGGVEERGGLLAGLVSRADLVLFPVDCVSHDAVSTVKRLCSQADKPYRPLRSGGLTSFAAALSQVDTETIAAV